MKMLNDLILLGIIDILLIIEVIMNNGMIVVKLMGNFIKFLINKKNSI